MAQTRSHTSIPAAAQVNYRDAHDIMAYSQRLIRDLSENGVVEYPLSCATQQLIDNARAWLVETERALPELPVGSIPLLLEAYDFIHLITTGTPAPETMLRRWWERAYEAMRGGDSSVTSSILMTQLQRRLATHPSSVTLPQLRWYCDTVTAWCDTLRHADSFADVTPDENRRRIALLLNEDLSMHLGDRQAATKRRWRHHLIDASGTCV